MNEIAVKKVKWHAKTKRISQIPKEGLEFAMLSKDYQQINQLVWCKDFMQDIIWSHINRKSIDLYGFAYDPEKSPAPSMARVRLMISNYKDLELANRLLNGVLPLLHSVEHRLGMPLTLVEQCQNPPPIYKKTGVYILTGSRRWLKSPPMLSLYTLLIRVGMVHKLGDSAETTLTKVCEGKTQGYFDKRCRDQRTVIRAMKGINRILNLSDRRLFPGDIKLNYPSQYRNSPDDTKEMSVSAIHNHCGIVGFSENTTKTYCPFWRNYEGAQS